MPHLDRADAHVDYRIHLADNGMYLSTCWKRNAPVKILSAEAVYGLVTATNAQAVLAEVEPSGNAGIVK